ncbi:30S ribosomal protein S20 [Acidiferrobacter sp.]|uniref:30S ribosomal protein S20 n=1 Tax=Acidiferrobacter sp. TaxID=1872107 RepID=UPI0026394E89|nr:30S ribosomal protein S20 [Acidiferrobacter sp.]
MANTAQAKKRARQAEIHRQRNVAFRSQVRSAIKKVLKAVHDKDIAAGHMALREASSVIDRGISRGIMHRNTAARYKSRLNARLHRASA